jgi:hypothetical protein
MNLFTPAPLTPKQIERRKEMRAKGRKHFIFYTGILRFGMSIFVVNILWRYYDEYGWHAPPRGDLYVDIAYLAFVLAIWLVAGYFVGVAMWTRWSNESTPGE